MFKNELEEQVRYHNELYTNGTPEISDAEFDELINQLRDSNPNSPVLLEIGATPSYGKKIKHEIPMGSLNKCNSVEEILKWKNTTNTSDLVWSEKIDGCSGEIIYEKGKMTQASSRGNGTEGSLLTDNILNTEIKNKISIKEKVVVRGEFYVTKSHFDLFFADTSANPRNFVSGSVQLKNPEDIKGRGVKFKVFRVLEPKQKTLIDEIEFAKQLGFNTVQLNKGIPTEDIINEYQNKKRNSLDYEIDGLVIQVNNNEDRESLGYTGFNSKGAIAFKFKPEVALTEVLDVEWNLGRSGRVTPVAILKPVSLMGSTISRATLHNHSEMSRLGITKNCKVELVKAGDIIPKVLKVVEKTNEQFSNPTICPSCKNPLRNDGVTYFCDNENCGDKLLTGIVHYLKAFDTKEVGSSVISTLISNGSIKSLSDIYTMTADNFRGLAGIGDRTMEIYFAVIDSIREVELAPFLQSLGMESIGKTLSKDFAKKFSNIEKIFNVTKQELLSMEGIAEVSANKILDELKKKTNLKNELLRYVKIKEQKVMSGKFIGMKFAFTGECNLKRKEMEKIIVDNGGEVGSPSKSTNYVIVGHEGAVQAKVDKVKSGGGKAITEIEFLNL